MKVSFKNKLYRKGRRFILFLLTIIFLCQSLCSLCIVSASSETDTQDKQLSVDLTGHGEGYSAVLYDNTNGLPTSEANAIAETNEGFIWIGSYSGLIRYDGNSFERFGAVSSLASIVSLFVDSNNRLWAGTNESGAAVMIDGEFKIFGKAEGLRSNSVRSITEVSNGDIYLGTTDGLAVVDKELHLEMINDSQLDGEYIRMMRTRGNIVYGVTKNGALFSVKARKVASFIDADTSGIEDIHSVLPDADNPGFAYIGSKGSQLYYAQLEDGFKIIKTIDISPCSYINAIESVGDMIWICTDTGIGFVVDDKFTPISNVPMMTSVEGMMRDYQKNLWFVSSQQGVMKIVPNQFTDIFDRYHIDSEVVYSTCLYEDRLFVGTKNSGLLVLDNGEQVDKVPISKSSDASGKTYPDTDLIEMLKESKIRSIIRDSKGRLWFSTFGEQGLLMYDKGKTIKFTESDGMPSERVRTVVECSDGTFLAVCTGGLAVIKDNKISKVYGSDDGIANTELLTVAEGIGGEYVVGTDGGGIYVIKDGGIEHYGTDEGLRSDVVMRIKKDVDRKLYWIITSNSIAYMTSDHKITTVSNFPYSNNFDLYENSSGEVWVLSSNGIYAVDVEQLLQDPEEMSYLFYNRDNGLPCLATSNSYSELTESGDLYIAGTTGIAKVNIEKPFENVSELKMAVPYIEIDGNNVYPDPDGNFSIPANTKKLTIYSYVYNYSFINPQVTYKLEGFDSDPVTVRRSELVPQSYTNLHGGDYSFILQIQDPHGLTSKEMTVNITKQKRFYELIWVHIVSFVVAAAVLIFAVRQYIKFKTQAAEKRSQRQKELIREIVEAFSKVIDMKDRYTNGHSARVAKYTVMLSKELGIDDETIDEYYFIALLHDIGKVGIPAEVLNKNGKLTDEEFRLIKSHSALGYNTLKNISIMPDLAIGAGAHHERPDGKGYPKGLKGDEIPRVAQIIAVADTFDAMYSDRPYRKRMNFEKAVSIIKECSGTQLTPDVVDAFLRLVDQGKMRAPDDVGGGSTEDINNIHKKNGTGLTEEKKDENKSKDDKAANDSKDNKDGKDSKNDENNENNNGEKGK